MIKDLTINTGTPRNVLGHVISGAIASAVVSGALNYKKASLTPHFRLAFFIV